MALFYGSSDKARSVEIARKVKVGKLRKLAPKLFTDDLRTAHEEVVRRHRLEIAAHFYPDAVISHRSALEGTLSPAGKLHLSLPGTVAPVRKLPGLEIRIWKGPQALEGDIPTSASGDGELYTAGQARAVLENFQISRARGEDEPKTLSPDELEAWFDRKLRVSGDGWLEDLKNKVSALASALGWDREFEAFRSFVAAMEGRPSAYRIKTDLAQSRADGHPYDPERIRLFAELQARLATESFKALPVPPVSERENRAFWESYFSNFIEGTRFTVEEARELVSDSAAARSLTRKRPQDAHDIMETYRLIVDPNISGEVPGDGAGLLELLKRRHARMMASRADVQPGVFKVKNNEVGSRIFVAPELVSETLIRGWKAAENLPGGLLRAIFLLFVVAEVHPFSDGNGRISRLGMNAELESAGLARLIIPTSLRNDYLSVLEALTSNGNPIPYIAFVHKLIDFNSRMPLGSFEEAHAHFRKTGALDEPGSSQFNIRPLLG
ncbi:MAG: Fic family protein [Opitutales bacterium]|nr:Fic family protein [Opitutales bacterium]